MKLAPSTLTISLLLNVALLAAAGFFFRKPVPMPSQRIVTKTIVTNENAREIVTNITSQVFEMKTNAPFDWSMVASMDLEFYVKNLRAIGCPEDTIRDIITAEVDEIFLKKLAERLDPIKQNFWFILANWKTQEKEIEANMKGVEKIGDERDEILKKLLGAGKDSTAETRPPSDRVQERLNFLPPEKQEQMLALTKTYNDERIKIQKEAGEPLTAEQQKRIEELRKKTDEDRKALMTPEEFEEYQLRGGNYAQFRFNAAMPEFSESEARTLAKIKMDFEQSKSALPAQSDPTYKTKMAERMEGLQQQIKTALGEERYADYDRADDGSFQQIYRVTERYSLPRETAVKVRELQKTVFQEAIQLHKDKGLSDDEREQLMFILQEETRRRVTQTLGENAAKTYQKHGGDWLKNLGDE